MVEGERTTSVKTWQDVLADYRYLRATLNALVQLDRQLSIDELVGSALNHDTMHGDTMMAILMQFEARLADAERKLNEAVRALERIKANAARGYTFGYEGDYTLANEALARLRSTEPTQAVEGQG